MESPSQHNQGELAATTAATASISLEARELASPTTDATKQRIAAANNKNGGASRGSSACSVSSAGDSDGESGCEKSEVDRTNGTGKEYGSRYLSVATAAAAGASGQASVGGKEQRSPSGNHLRPAGTADCVRSTAGGRRGRSSRSRSRSARSPIQLAAKVGVGSAREAAISVSGLPADRGGGSSSSGGAASTIAVWQSPVSAFQRRSGKKGFSEPSSASVSRHGSIRRMAIGRTFSVPEKSVGSQRGSTSAAAAASFVAPVAASRRRSGATSLAPAGIADGGPGRTNDSSEEDLVKAGAAALAAAGVALRAALGEDGGSDGRSPRDGWPAAERLAIAAGGQRSSQSRDLTPLNKATLQAVEKTVEAIDDLRGRPEHDIDRYVDSNLEDATLSVVRHCLKAVLSMDVDQSNFQMYATLAEASKKRRKRRSESKRRATAAAAVAAAYAPAASRSGAARQSVPSHVVAPRRRRTEPAAAGKLSSSAGPPPRVHPTARPEAGYEWALHRVGCPQDMANYYYYRHSTKPRYKWVQVKIRRPVARPPYDWAAEAGYKPFREREIWQYNDRHHFPPYCYPVFNSLRHPFSKADSPPQAKIAPLVELPPRGRRPSAAVPDGTRGSSRTARVASR